MAPGGRLELPTNGLTVRCSARLSYPGKAGKSTTGQNAKEIKRFLRSAASRMLAGAVPQTHSRGRMFDNCLTRLAATSRSGRFVGGTSGPTPQPANCRRIERIDRIEHLFVDCRSPHERGREVRGGYRQAGAHHPGRTRATNCSSSGSGADTATVTCRSAETGRRTFRAVSSEPRRLQAERFERYQRQFARARQRREYHDFHQALDEFVGRACSPPPPPPPSAASVTPVVSADANHAAFDQQVRDLLVRVHDRPALPPDPIRPRSRPGYWWSPQPVLGFRIWELLGGHLTGVRLPWFAPELSAVCLHKRGSEQHPVPHDVRACGRPPCGIYALKDVERIREGMCHVLGRGRTVAAAGVVEMSGRVIEHSGGYRAEHARVVALVVFTASGGWTQLDWFEDPKTLTALFSDPKRVLESAATELRPIDEAFDDAFRHLDAYAASRYGPVELL